MSDLCGVDGVAEDTRGCGIFSRVEARRTAAIWLSRRDVLVALSAIAVVVIAWHVFRKLNETSAFGFDTMAYWTVDPAAPYGRVAGDTNAFLYAPPFATLFGVLNDLPWPVFHGLWLIVELAALVWLAREWTLVVLALPPVFNELFFGNINLLYPVAIIVGFRWSGTWALLLLTKVTPGIGLLWFVVRREWRAVGTALAVTGAIVVVSYLLTPGIWRDWLTVLATSDSMAPANTYRIPLIPRLVAAALLITWGALTDRRWTVVVGTALALPVLWSAGLSILVGLVPLIREDLARWRDAAPAIQPGPVAERSV
jgi:hypothetical protein